MGASYTFGAGRSFSLDTSETKIPIMLKAASGVPATIWQYAVSFDGELATEPKIECQLVRFTTDGTMSSETGVKLDTEGSDPRSSLYHTATSDPTAGEVIFTFLAHAQGGIFQPAVQPVIVRPGERVGIRVINLGTVSTAHSYRAWMGVTE